MAVHARDFLDREESGEGDDRGVGGARRDVAGLSHQLDDPGRLCLAQRLLAEDPAAHGLRERDLRVGAGELLYGMGGRGHEVRGERELVLAALERFVPARGVSRRLMTATSTFASTISNGGPVEEAVVQPPAQGRRTAELRQPRQAPDRLRDRGFDRSQQRPAA